MASFPVEQRPDGVYVELPDVERPIQTVGEVLVESLVAFGITHVFGIVGHSNLGFAEALRKAEERGEITYIGIRHEGAAAFAASAYGKLTGRPAMCFAIAVKHLLLDNHALGKISREQLAAGVPGWHTSLRNPDWAASAELCGATGLRVDRREQLDDALAMLFAADGPALLSVEQDAQLL